MHFTITGLTRSRDEIYEVQVHFQWAQYIWTTFLRGLVASLMVTYHLLLVALQY